MNGRNLVEVKNLKKYFPVSTSFIEGLITRERLFVRAVDDISFTIKKGEVMGLCGESGCGKTTTGRMIMRLLDATEGTIHFEDEDITDLTGGRLRRFRPNMQMVFQDPHASLNPRMTVAENIGHSLAVQHFGNRQQRRERIAEVMESVALTPVHDISRRYPHLLSGGQKQRVVLARALAVNPKLVVADEPIAMADVSVRALILELMLKLKEEYNLTYLFVTHDLATAKYICDRVAIMYLGVIVEIGTIAEVFENPRHPYTQALLTAVPVPDPAARRQHAIPRGEIPSAVNPPPGCRFHTRCPMVEEECRSVVPDMVEITPTHRAACRHIK
jgi:peptide/nickel transport system ATP-binding protein